ncbi:hypothetical protein E2320_006806, partial [Naja naja]
SCLKGPPQISSLAQLQNTWPVACEALGEAHQAPKKEANKNSTQQPRKPGPKDVGLLPIAKVIKPVTLYLQLSKNLTHTLPAFHCSLLKPKSACPKSGPGPNCGPFSNFEQPTASSPCRLSLSLIPAGWLFPPLMLMVQKNVRLNGRPPHTHIFTSPNLALLAKSLDQSATGSL